MKLSSIGAAFAAAIAVGLALAPAPALAAKPAAAAAPSAEQAIKASLDQGAAAFNRGDFEAYLHDFFPRIRYNEVMIQRKQLVEMNQDLKQAFPNLSMRYRKVRINPLGADKATATTVAELSGKTDDYQGSGLPASYREEGMVTSLYEKVGGKWATPQLQVAWTDSYIDIGRDFGMMGFSTLPALVGTEQPYGMRLYVGRDDNPGVKLRYAYALAPIEQILEKGDAEKVFAGLDYKPFPVEGVKARLSAPVKAGTYVHILVVDKYWSHGDDEVPIGQKVYSRLVRVE